MTRIAVAGDWHGEYGWAKRAIRFLAAQNVKTIVHVGDFAIGFNNDSTYTAPIQGILEELDMMLLITPGNHDNWDVINSLPVLEDGEYAGFLRLRDRILVAPRAHRWNMEGVSFVSLGGGNSIDYQGSHRIQGQSWWREEAIGYGDINKIEEGGHADIMIAHVAPFSAVYKLDSMGWPESAVRYSDESRYMMGIALDAVKPELFFHGHYHTDKRQVSWCKDGEGNTYKTEFVSLGMNGKKNNLAYLDLATREVQFIGWPYN